MKRSFKLHLFLRLILLVFVIIGANRLIAQQFLTEQLRDEIHQEMGFALKTCQLSFDNRKEFLSCFKDTKPGSLISNVADYYVMCPRKTGLRQRVSVTYVNVMLQLIFGIQKSPYCVTQSNFQRVNWRM